MDGLGAPGRLSPCSFVFPARGQTLGRGRRGRSERRARPRARVSAARSPPTLGFALVVLVTCSQLPVGDGARAGVQGRSLSPPCPSRAGRHRPFVQRPHTACSPPVSHSAASDAHAGRRGVSVLVFESPRFYLMMPQSLDFYDSLLLQSFCFLLVIAIPLIWCLVYELNFIAGRKHSICRVPGPP